MPINIFKQPQEKADSEWRQAYDKGVNLGPQNWPDAAQHFNEASKHYATVGNSQKSAESYALATLFYALTNPSDQAWRSCSDAMRQIPDTQLNLPFAAQSISLAQQAEIQASDLSIAGRLDPESKDTSRAVAARDLAQKYLGLIGNDLSIWKLKKHEMDPQRRAYFLLGLASLIEANGVADADPKKSVSLLSEATTYLDPVLKDLYSIHCADLRIVYKFTDNPAEIELWAIEHRKHVYDELMRYKSSTKQSIQIC